MCNPALSQVSRLKPRGLVIPHLEGTIYNLFCKDLFYRHAILMTNLANETAQNGESNCIFASFLLRALDSTFTSFMTPISINFFFRLPYQFLCNLQGDWGPQDCFSIVLWLLYSSYLLLVWSTDSYFTFALGAWLPSSNDLPKL